MALKCGPYERATNKSFRQPREPWNDECSVSDWLRKFPNTTIRQRTEFKDAYIDALQRKFRWAGHVARYNDNRWTNRTTFWWPDDFRRPRGRPADRWRKLMQDQLGRNWHELAKNRTEYKNQTAEVLSSLTFF